MKVALTSDLTNIPEDWSCQTLEVELCDVWPLDKWIRYVQLCHLGQIPTWQKLSLKVLDIPITKEGIERLFQYPYYLRSTEVGFKFCTFEDYTTIDWNSVIASAQEIRIHNCYSHQIEGKKIALTLGHICKLRSR